MGPREGHSGIRPDGRAARRFRDHAGHHRPQGGRAGLAVERAPQRAAHKDGGAASGVERRAGHRRRALLGGDEIPRLRRVLQFSGGRAGEAPPPQRLRGRPRGRRRGDRMARFRRRRLRLRRARPGAYHCRKHFQPRGRAHGADPLPGDRGLLLSSPDVAGPADRHLVFRLQIPADLPRGGGRGHAGGEQSRRHGHGAPQDGAGAARGRQAQGRVSGDAGP